MGWIGRLFRRRAPVPVTTSVKRPAIFALVDSDTTVPDEEIAAFLAQDEESQLRQYTEYLDTLRDNKYVATNSCPLGWGDGGRRPGHRQSDCIDRTRPAPSQGTATSLARVPVAHGCAAGVRPDQWWASDGVDGQAPKAAGTGLFRSLVA